MKSHLTTILRGALLPAIAAVALLAAMPAAQADQQETNAQMDNATNWQAARDTGFSDGYAQAGHSERVYVRHHADR